MCFYIESISSLCWMKCTSLMSKDTKSWTVLFRNTPPSDRVYMWGSGNPHVHVKYWHLWWKRKKKLSEGVREGDGERETEIESVLDPLLLSHYRTSTLIWTSFELIFQSVLASKEDSGKPRPFWKHVFLEADETPIICKFSSYTVSPMKTFLLLRWMEHSILDVMPSGQPPIKDLETIQNTTGTT